MHCLTWYSFMANGHGTAFRMNGMQYEIQEIPEHPRGRRHTRLMHLGTLCQSRHQFGVLTMLGNSIIFLTPSTSTTGCASPIVCPFSSPVGRWSTS
jgi:hypothetical protein